MGGGLTLAAGLGCAGPIWAGAGLSALGLVVFLVAARARGGEFARPCPEAAPMRAGA